MYGCETWTLRKEERDRLSAFEMWVWRRMEKVSWRDKKTNEHTHDVNEKRFVGRSIEKKEELDRSCCERGKGY